jgi:hypothetical protein
VVVEWRWRNPPGKCLPVESLQVEGWFLRLFVLVLPGQFQVIELLVEVVQKTTNHQFYQEDRDLESPHQASKATK